MHITMCEVLSYRCRYVNKWRCNENFQNRKIDQSITVCAIIKFDSHNLQDLMSGWRIKDKRILSYVCGSFLVNRRRTRAGGV